MHQEALRIVGNHAVATGVKGTAVISFHLSCFCVPASCETSVNPRNTISSGLSLKRSPLES